ncbi:MAG: hypothetical protein HY318_04415 [Armatimonadetes bacterium]|nr:hypothetical protein [Armatimonadota bacterium]
MNVGRLPAWAALFALLVASGQTASPAPSKIWPASDEGAVWMIENLPNLEIPGFMIGPDKAQAPEELYPVLEVPAYVEFFSVAYVYSQEAPQPKVTEISRDGKPYKRYRFGRVNKDTDRWARIFTQWVPYPSEQDRRNPGVFAWHFETPEGPEPEQALPVKLLPELPKTRPAKRMLVHFYNSPNCNLQPATVESLPAGVQSLERAKIASSGEPDPERLSRVLELLSRSGVNLLGWWEASAAAMKQAGCYEKGLRLHVNMGGMHGWKTMGKISEDPRYRNRDKDGRPVEGQEAQWVLDENGKPWADDLAACKHYAAQVDAMTQDIEWGPVYDGGFSQAGIEAFARRFRLDSTTLTPQEIWKRHRKQWGDFRAEQYLKLALLYSKAAHEGNPKAFTLWNPGSPYTSTDPDLMSDMIELGKDSLGRMVYLTFPFPTDRMQEAFGVLEPMWYSHGVGQVREAFEWTRAITKRVKVDFAPLYLGQGREFYYPGGDPGEVLRAMFWATILGGAKGYGFWLNEFSPLQFWWMARANREISRVEDVLLDGKPDPADVKITPLPKKRFTLMRGKEKKVFPVPDFSQIALWRAFALGNRRLIGVINTDLGVDCYYRISVARLPAGRYRVLDVSEGYLLTSKGSDDTFTHTQLRQGIMMMTPARYGIRLLLIAPAAELGREKAGRRAVSAIQADYRKYREPDTEGAVLAERGKLSIRYDMVGKKGDTAILIESPVQQVWIRPQTGGILSDWKIKDGNRTVAEWLSGYHGAAVDLFWSPADAHWSGDEKGAYELVYAKVHGSKAWVQLRQTKQTPALQGLRLTKTIVVPEDRTDVEVRVEISNPGPAPSVGFSYWAHQMLTMGPKPGKAGEPQPVIPQIFMQTNSGVTEAPATSVVWAKPNQPYLLGNESWERDGRNGTTTGDWIAQRDPITGETVLCQAETAVAQFYNWRDDLNKADLSLEWMFPYTTLEAGKAWNTRYVLRYLKSIAPKDLPSQLLPQVQ